MTTDMHDATVFFLGVALCFIGWYVYYVRRGFAEFGRRLTEIKGVMLEAVNLLESRYREVETMDRRVDRLTERAEEQAHQIQFLLENRTVPPRDLANAPTYQKEGPTAWDRLRNEINKL